MSLTHTQEFLAEYIYEAAGPKYAFWKILELQPTKLDDGRFVIDVNEIEEIVPQYVDLATEKTRLDAEFVK